MAHDATGTATVYELPTGKRILRFSDFKVSNGPDVHVYLVAVDDAKDNKTVKDAEILTLGPIKGNIGDQNYVLPSDVDLKKFRTVVIWCKRFGVNFASAALDEN
ncbi:DM13 domain-containing protein [Desulfobacterota bacterium AH_259_B03_O07]|nr:DM13 domain-containing protein [Desulfobacterota bacterium AH_259_B03_O07]